MASQTLVVRVKLQRPLPLSQALTRILYIFMVGMLLISNLQYVFFRTAFLRCKWHHDYCCYYELLTFMLTLHYTTLNLSLRSPIVE